MYKLTKTQTKKNIVQWKTKKGKLSQFFVAFLKFSFFII